jgi:hypothetical protein
MKIQKCSNAGYSFKEVMEKFFDLCTPGEVDINVEIARRIWFRRTQSSTEEIFFILMM